MDLITLLPGKMNPYKHKHTHEILVSGILSCPLTIQGVHTFALISFVHVAERENCAHMDTVQNSQQDLC